MSNESLFTVKLILTLSTAASLIFVGATLLCFSPLAPFSETVVTNLIIAGFVLCGGGILIATIGIDHIR